MRKLHALLVCLVLLCAAGIARAAAPDATSASALTDAIEQARAEMRIPGCAIAVVLDDKVVLARGFGSRDVERNLPVTENTLFAIGSCTKAFTAMSAAILADDGKLALDDSPKKFLPWFKLQDPEADANVTLRDMLCHRTGLGSTDLAWYTGVLSRHEAIRVAGDAKPTAKLREKFQYQNVMYSAAGEAAAAAGGTTWEKLVTEKILRPLGMKQSVLSVAEMQKSSDFSRGYAYDMASKVSRLTPTRDLTNIAPAGAINSSAREMALWVRLMLGGGAIDGRRLVSEKMFKELTSAQMKAPMGGDYALGWITHPWRDATVIEHAGGIDGFNAHVVIIPQKKLGYALLTNVSGSTLDARVREIVWKHLIDGSGSAPPPPASQPAMGPALASGASTQPAEKLDPKSVVGKYGMLEIVHKEGALFAVVPDQPEYRLELVGAHKYKLGGAPDGFFITFRETKDGGREIYLEQPHGNYALPREPSKDEATDAAATYDGPNKDLLGTYETQGFSMDVTVRGGKVVAVVTGQPTYTLTPIDGQKDAFTIPPAPDGFALHFHRDDNGKVTGVLVKQPHGNMELTRAADAKQSDADQKAVDDLIRRAVEAMGGEANLRRHGSRTIKYDAVLENQGIAARGSAVERRPDAYERTTEFVALGKPIGTMKEVFDGKTGRVEGSFVPTTPYESRQIEEARSIADFDGPLGWRQRYKSIRIKGTRKLGDERAHIVELKPPQGPMVTAYVSAKSHLLLRREYTGSQTGAAEPVTETFGDWREVDGVKVPFRTEVKSASMGTVVQTVTEVKFGS